MTGKPQYTIPAVTAAGSRTRRNDQALAALERVSIEALAHYPTPVEELVRLHDAIGGPRLFIKRDDAISFAFGGNKVRKLEVVAARALADGADTLITAGGVQSNHARVTAAAAAQLGLRCVLVANGVRPEPLTANALLDRLLGAEVVYVASRADRGPAMEQLAADANREGRRPCVIPIGASTPLGALGFVRAVAELSRQMPPPDVIVHATSSGGTQAGLVAGCLIHGMTTKVIGISADDPAGELEAKIRGLVRGVGELLGIDGEGLAAESSIEVDDTFVGEGYGVPTPASREALDLTAARQAIFLDHTYSAKAMAGLIDGVRSGRFASARSILFWHTGGQVGLFA